MPPEWLSFREKIAERLRLIPSGRELHPGMLDSLLKGIACTPEEALEILDAAHQRVKTRTDIKDPRAWCLKALQTPAFAKDLLSSQSTCVPSEESAADPRLDSLAAAGLNPQGAKAVLAGLPSTLDSATLGQVLEILKPQVEVRKKQGQVGNPSGLLVHLLRNLDPEVLRRARRQTTTRPDRTGWNKLAPTFRRVQGAEMAFRNWEQAKRRLLAMTPSDGGYPEAIQESQRARKALAQIVASTLAPKELAEIEDTINQDLQGSGLAQDGIAWKWLKAERSSELLLARLQLEEPEPGKSLVDSSLTLRME